MVFLQIGIHNIHSNSPTGHDGTWVAHPGLVPLAKEVFDQHMKSSTNQLEKQLADFQTDNQHLTMPPEGVRTEAGFRRNISVTLGLLCVFALSRCPSIPSIGYLDNWLRGVGCVPLYNLMEDAATAEISRAQVDHPQQNMH